MTKNSRPPKTTYAGEPLPEVKIFTNRLLSAETTEKVLNALLTVDHIRQMHINGEYLPPKVKSGPNTGIDVNHPERKIIKYGEQEVLLTNLVGAFFIELKGEEFIEAAVEEIKTICDEVIPFGYTMDVGRYSKYKPTLTDYMKG